MFRATSSPLAEEKIVFDPGFPAVLLIGEVVGLVPPAGPSPPLQGVCLVLTHPAAEEDVLREALRANGAEVLECPCIEIVPPEESAPLRALVRKLGDYHWLLLTSKNAVDALADTLEELKLDARAAAACKIGVVGDATARRLWERLRLRPDVIPSEFTGEGLAETLVSRGEISGRRFLFPCSEIAREDLPKRLEEAGGIVDRVTSYRTVTPSAEWPCRDRLEPGQVQGVVFTSSSTVTGFWEKMGAKPFADLFKDTIAFSIGKKTTATLRELGVSNVREAAEEQLSRVGGSDPGRFLRTTLSAGAQRWNMNPFSLQPSGDRNPDEKGAGKDSRHTLRGDCPFCRDPFLPYPSRMSPRSDSHPDTQTMIRLVGSACSRRVLSAEEAELLEWALVQIALEGSGPIDEIVSSYQTSLLAGADWHSAVSAAFLQTPRQWGASIQAAISSFEEIRQEYSQSEVAAFQFADRVITAHLGEVPPLPGFVPVSAPNDPRPDRLLDLAGQSDVSGETIELAKVLTERFPYILKGPYKLNFEGALAALFCDLDIGCGPDSQVAHVGLPGFRDFQTDPGRLTWLP